MENKTKELRDHNYCKQEMLPLSSASIENARELRDHDYCIRDTAIQPGPCNRTNTSNLSFRRECNSTSQQNEPDIDIMIDHVQPPKPVYFCPLSANQRKVVCSKLGFRLDKNLSGTFLTYRGIGNQCIAAPLKQVNAFNDGNCMFRSFSYLLIGSEVKHDIVRSQVCNYIADPENWLKLHSYIEDYNSGEAYITASKMNVLSTWGTAVELFAFAQLTGKDVVVYTADRWLCYCSSGKKFHMTKTAFYLDNRSEMHYDPVLGVPSCSNMHSNPVQETTDSPDVQVQIGYITNIINQQAKRQNLERQRRFLQCLKSPEKREALEKYRQRQVRYQKEYRKCLKTPERKAVLEKQRQRHVKEQRQYEKRLRTPEKKDALKRQQQRNVNKQKRYQQLLKTPEKKTALEKQRHRMTEYQKLFRLNLRTPEKQQQFVQYKKQNNARKRVTERRTAARKKKTRPREKYRARHSLDTFIEASVNTHDIGQMSYMCTECDALMFKGETSDIAVSAEITSAKFSLCCSYGSIKLPPIKEPPDQLKMLLTGSTARDRAFCSNIRAYNSSLAFASMCLTQKEYKFGTKGPFCFRINGQVYHALSQLQPEEGQTPRFSQIYIYDEGNELNHRLECFQQLDPTLLQELQDTIQEVNPYAHTYQHAGDIMRKNPTVDIKLLLRGPTENKHIDPRRYNLPTGTDVAVILPEDRQTVSHQDIVVYKNAASHPCKKSLERIKAIHPMYDPLMYVLIFPFGDLGWEAYYKSGEKKCSAMQYYKYRLMIHANTFNTIHRMGRLFQQYVVDMYVKIEDGRLQYVRANQDKIRAELYQGLADAVQSGENNTHGSHIGKKVIFPSSFTSGARYQHQLYQDAMAIVRRFGKPDFFITFTCNPKWKEITGELLEHQTAADRQDVVARVFKQKLHSLLQDLYYGSTGVLANMIALIYVIEWQKRGLPHVHILTICDNESKPVNTEDFDSIVCAEIPDEQHLPELHKIVTTQMMHGPCGVGFPDSPCMVNGKCCRMYPKEFVKETYAAADGYPHYRRRNDGKFTTKKGIKLDNRSVVPYNPYLSKKYNAHINVEICNSIQSWKYLYKYVYKGPDMASVQMLEEKDEDGGKSDEISRFVNSQYVTASEACWRIFGFPIHGRDPSIQRLAVHEENLQMVYFNEDNPQDTVANPKKTTLMGWFDLNERDPEARQWKYHQIPEHYVWNTSQEKWTARKRGRVIGRMYTTNPAQGERHYLRMLLNHIPGATSYSDLKRSENGIVQGTFKQAAMKLGLLESDEEWNQCLSEAGLSFMPCQLRSLFVTILIFGEPVRPETLWETYKQLMGEDVFQQAANSKMSTDDIQKYVTNEILLRLQEELQGMGTCLENFGLPTPDANVRIKSEPRAIEEETYDTSAQIVVSEMKVKNLNREQREAFNMIMEAVENEDCPQQMFFVNAPGGYGKTYLIEALLATVRSKRKIALAVASSGIAAELVEGGRTAHSRFKIPIPANESSVANISWQSDDAKLMQKTSLIIWDEVMMAHLHHIECVDRSLRDICEVDKPYGGITTVFSGDPRQILPVVRHGSRAEIMKACVHSSQLWSQVKQLQLTTNMRVAKDELEFSKYVLAIGDGKVETNEEVGQDMIQIPKKYLVETLHDLIDKVFPHIAERYSDKFYIARRAILTPKNDDVDMINELIMSKFPGQGKTYLSADSVGEDDQQDAYPTEYLNTLTLSGMPPHEMTLKIGAPVMLLRNLRGGCYVGLRNGTRLIVMSLGEKVLEVEIASGVHKGKRVLIPRITFVPSDTELPFTLRRRQFPVRPCFAMSTNKAQGQTLDFVGIHLPDHVFTHGQLYVAFSRVRNGQSVAVHVNNKEGYTKNIVFKDIL